MKTSLIYILLFSFLLVSCGPKEDVAIDVLQSQLDEIEKQLSAKDITSLQKQKSELEAQIAQLGTEEKQPFYVDVASSDSLKDSIEVTKTAVLTGDSSVFLSANATGGITNMYAKNGDVVAAGQVIATLSDSITGYYTLLSDAQVGLSNARISYDQIVANTTKSQIDSMNALTKAEEDLKSAKLDAEGQRVQTQNSKDTAQVDENIEKLTLALQQTQLDYDNLLLTNAQTIANYENTYEAELQSLKIYMTNVVDSLDELFGVSDRYNSGYDTYRQFLGARDTGLRNSTRLQVQELVDMYGDFGVLSFSGTLAERIQGIDEQYDSIANILDNTEQVLIYSLSSEGSLSETDIATFRSEIDVFQATYQTKISTLATFVNQSSSFLATYVQNEEIAAARLSSQKLDTQIQVNNLEASRGNIDATYSQGLENIDRSVRQAQDIYDRAKTAYDALIIQNESQISSAQNAITSAQNRVNSANRNVGLLSVRAPFSGTISDISVDIGQQISTGTTIARITSQVASMKVGVSDDVAVQIRSGDSAEISYKGNTYVGSVVSVSTVANNSLSYEVEIQSPDITSSFGDFATVSFRIQPKIFALPITAVQILSEQSGRVPTWNNDELVWLPVELGKIWGNSIEILTEIPEGTDIILTNMENFDSNASTLTLASN